MKKFTYPLVLILSLCMTTLYAQEPQYRGGGGNGHGGGNNHGGGGNNHGGGNNNGCGQGGGNNHGGGGNHGGGCNHGGGGNHGGNHGGGGNCNSNPNKVVICHIPPGNPANAHNIEISVNALPAHIPGNNQHSDFLGDCFSACDVMEIVSYTQGLQSDGTAVPLNRSKVGNVFDIDGVNNDGGFYTLGFGGQITLKMEGGIINRPGNDLKIYETSFGQPSCSSYPEKAEIWVSKDNVNYHLAGVVCQDGEVDIAPLDWIQYVKVVDISVASQFGGVVDGFDLDGITCIPMATTAAQSRLMVEQVEVKVFPNPVKDVMNLTFNSVTQTQDFQITVRDFSGRTVLTRKQNVEAGNSMIQIDVTGLKSGVHFLSVESTDFTFEDKIIVR